MGQLTDKQQLFCEEYIVDLNATQAAIRAGYSEKTAYSIGWENLRKPEIKEYIEKYLDEMAMSKAETLKAISDIARASINDYFILKDTVHVPREKIGLREAIKRIMDEIEDSEKLLSKIDVSDEFKEAHERNKANKLITIAKYEIELERNPDSAIIVDGTPELIQVAELDIAKLVQDKAAGKIKSYSVSETGQKVEMYAADGALNTLAKIHGMFEKDNKQREMNITLPTIQIVKPNDS